VTSAVKIFEKVLVGLCIVFFYTTLEIKHGVERIWDFKYRYHN